jgi:hypothetical protein
VYSHEGERDSQWETDFSKWEREESETRCCTVVCTQSKKERNPNPQWAAS